MARVFIVDAFTSRDGRAGTGNPAAVVALGSAPFPPSLVLQRVAAEHNLSETSFYRSTAPARFALRWFTPEQEVDLCGHATLATAFVALTLAGGGAEADDAITFETLSGELTVARLESGALELDFPSRPPVPMRASDAPDALFVALGISREEALFVGKARDFVIELATPARVRSLKPDFALLSTVDALCIAVSARTHNVGAGAVDVVSRVFCPGCGVPEDPVTGSAHCSIVPHFAAALGRTTLCCEQASARGGELVCEVRQGGARVALAGHAALFSSGEIVASALRD